MKSLYTAALCLVFFLIPSFAEPPATDSWLIVWSDEFDSGSIPEYPNPSHWGYESAYIRNQEWQYYTDELQNAYCQDGMLHIEAHKHPVGTYPSGTYTGQDGSISSASLHSSNKITFQYGWLEMRARIDTQPACWPGFWTLGRWGSWPDSGECDIMEHAQNQLNFTCIWWKTGDDGWGRWDREEVSLASLPSGWEDDFHTWSMEWTPEYVYLYMDGVLYNTWDASQDDNGSGDTSMEAFQQPHYILLSQAIGGLAGDASTLVYPTNFEIDYVRCYRKLTTYVPEHHVDERHANVSYDGSWHNWQGNPSYSCTERYCYTADSTSTFSFTGNRVVYYGTRRDDLGMAEILLDGQLVNTVDCYNTEPQYFSPLYVSPQIQEGEHTLTVKVTGNKNPSSSGHTIIVDAFGYSNDVPSEQLYDRSDFTVNDIRGSDPYETGNQFTTGSNPPTITALGFIDLNNTNPTVDSDGDGLLESHRVTLWLDSDGSKVTEVTVPAGTSGKLIDSFRYAAIPEGSLTLASDTAYVVSADTGGIQDPWLNEEALTPNAYFIDDKMTDSTTWQGRWAVSGQWPIYQWHTGTFYGLANVSSAVIFYADFDDSGAVDISDLKILVDNWLLDVPVYDSAPQGGDGIINLREFQILAEEWAP